MTSSDKWVPRRGEDYWTFSLFPDGRVREHVWCDDETDNILAAAGRVFRTQEEAQVACDDYLGRTTVPPDVETAEGPAVEPAPEPEQKAEGRKDDQGKAPWGLLPFDAVGQIVEVLRVGAQKYSPRNWEAGMDWNRPFDACLRHLTAWWGGEDKDPETGLSHLAHAGCCILFLLAYSRRGAGKDNRPKKMY